MDFQEYEIEDFLQDRSFRNYCLGINEEDQAFWENWIVLHPAKYGKVQEARLFLEMLNGNNTAERFKKDIDAFEANLKLHLATADSQARTASLSRHAGVPVSSAYSRKHIVWFSIAIAASLGGILFFNAGRPGETILNGKTLPNGYAKISNAGERKSFQLSDGTKVMLNAGSEIHIPADFNVRGREITLEGEAFFDVAKDAQKPFLLHTASMDIRVLGTSFNVKAYLEDKITETSLLNGSIEVMVRKSNRKILLHPSEKIVVYNTRDIPARDSPRVRKQSFLHEDYVVKTLTFNPEDRSLAEVSWTENRLVFNNNSFEEIALALERWYNVSIQFEDPSLKEFRFTASFDKKTIEQVLAALAASRPFEFRHEQGNKTTYKISNMKN